jgi:heme/copper-type cytochrome/quinol oxidase subunit 1
VSDLLEMRTDDYDDEPDIEVTTSPRIPVLMLLITAMSSVLFLVGAITDEAGSTDEVSAPAVFAWLFGSMFGLLIYAWFGLLDSVRRSTGFYEEPSWRPRVVAAVLATVGWLAGSAGAFLVAEAVARR